MKANPTIVHRDPITVSGWHKFSVRDPINHVWQMARDWLNDWGMDIMSYPDQCADTNVADVTAFRVDSADEHVIVLVRLDVDGAPDGRTCVDWVEVTRA